MRMSVPKPVVGAVCLGAGAAFILLLPLGQRAVQRIRLGPAFWTFLSLIPLVHMFAMHRVARHLEERMRELDQQRSPAKPAIPEPSGRLAPAVAEVAWFLTAVPWALWRSLC